VKRAAGGSPRVLERQENFSPAAHPGTAVADWPEGNCRSSGFPARDLCLEARLCVVFFTTESTADTEVALIGGVFGFVGKEKLVVWTVAAVDIGGWWAHAKTRRREDAKRNVPGLNEPLSTPIWDAPPGTAVPG